MGRIAKVSADAILAQTLRTRHKRRVFRKSGTDDAARLIGPLTLGDEICGITNGQFSLIDIIEHILTETGPSDITVASWTMGIYDIDRANEFVRNGFIKSSRWILDPSFFSRRPDLASILVKGFGAESFRGVNTHAKFATIRGSMPVAIRSSMNLNPNKRLENFDISVDEHTTAFFEAIVDDIWLKVPVGNESQSESLFHALLDERPTCGRKMPNPWLPMD